MVHLERTAVACCASSVPHHLLHVLLKSDSSQSKLPTRLVLCFNVTPVVLESWRIKLVYVLNEDRGSICLFAVSVVFLWRNNTQHNLLEAMAH